MTKAKMILGIVAVCSVLATGASGCNAENLNAVIDATSDLAGVEVDVEIKQEDLDKVEHQVNELKDNVEAILEDEEVRDAAAGLMDALSGAIKDTEE